MVPFLHIGPLTLASFGLCVGVAMLVSYFVLARDFARRGIAAHADLFVAVPCVAGLVGARLYHVFEDPHALFADPSLLVSRYGFAWFGGFLGGFAAFILLARYYRLPLLKIFDAASPAAALGYGIGRIGCLLSGDGDYGKPTSLPWGMSFPHGLVPTVQKVHPTPIYELLIAIVIFWILWKLGARQIRAHGETNSTASRAKNAKATASSLPAQAGFAALRMTKKENDAGSAEAGLDSGSVAPQAGMPRGTVFAWYLLLTGVARFLIEFIRINPRSFFGMTNAQTAALVSIIIGVALIAYLRRKAASILTTSTAAPSSQRQSRSIRTP